VPFRWIVTGLFAAALVVTLLVYTATPTGFLPDEDLGFFYISIQAPQGISLQPKLAAIPSAKILAFNLPAVQGIGAVGGFQYELEDPTNGNLTPLGNAAAGLVTAANTSGNVTRANTTFSNAAPHYVITVDRDKAEAASVNVGDIFDVLQTDVGSKYVNDFTYNNRTYHVYLQGNAPDRSRFEDLQKPFVRSSSGGISPVTDYLSSSFVSTAPIITHYNLFRNIEITGQSPPGKGSGQALGTMEQLSQQLPSNLTHEWSGISLEQVQGGGASAILFGLGLLFVFFVLAAQYESLSEPFIILLATPVAILGALAALHLRGIASDVYAQVGYVLLIGLASKNAILIVEFANQLRAEGLSATDAVIRAAEIRLRPILMTLFAFILGIVPLVFASGAGAASRHSLGTAVLGGMLVSTILNLGIIPALYLIVARFDHRHDAQQRPPGPAGNGEARPGAGNGASVAPVGVVGWIPVERNTP